MKEEQWSCFSVGRVSEVLNHKRWLSLQMVKRLHEGLHIPYDVPSVCRLVRGRKKI